jgi:membrane protein YdbS with pleckstrin-like domain
MQCSQCLGEIEDDSRFCRHCGAALASDAGPAPPKQGDVHRDPAAEHLVWQGRPSWRAYYGWWLLWAAASATLLVACYQGSGVGNMLRTAAWLLVLGSAAFLLAVETVTILGQHYRLTTQRLFVHHGIVTRVTDQMELIRVDDVRLRQGPLDRLVNTGEIEVMSTDKTDETLILSSVSAPAEVAEALRRQVRGARGKQTLFVENV